MRRVTVYWWRGPDKIKIGELAQGRDTPIVFEWDAEFLAGPIELSPIRFKKMPGLIEFSPQTLGGLQGLFADHVPDGWGRILLRRGLGVEFDEISSLDLLRYIGDRGMGALSFAPGLRDGEEWADGQIDLDALEMGVEPILAGTPSEVLNTFLSGGASANGIRPKIIAKEVNDKLFVGQEDLKAAEWIIKFRAPEDSADIGKLEYIYSLMARNAGVNVPQTRLFRTKKGYFFGSKRFDRNDGIRMHMHTLSGLLNVSPTNFSIGYEHFAKVAMALTTDIRAVEQVFRIAVFNILSCNQDDHSRNVSFLMDASGTWSVAPAYDLTFHRNRSDEHKMGIQGNGKPTEADLKRFGLDLGLSKKLISQILDRCKASLSGFSQLAVEYSLSKAERVRVGEVVLGKGWSAGPEKYR